MALAAYLPETSQTPLGWVYLVIGTIAWHLASGRQILRSTTRESAVVSASACCGRLLTSLGEEAMPPRNPGCVLEVQEKGT